MTCRVAIALSLLLAGPAAAQNHYALAAVAPLPAGTVRLTNLPASAPYYRAYQGMTWQVYAEADGGHWPYTCTLTNAPAGMTVVSGPATAVGASEKACQITWTNPQATATPTIRWTDRLGAYVEVTWTINVVTTGCTTSGYCFVDPVAGNDTTGNGSIGSPYATIAKVKNDVSALHAFVVLRAGTSTVNGMTATASSDCGTSGKIEFTVDGNDPMFFMAYPGETATIDFESPTTEDRPCIRFNGDTTTFPGLQGLRVINCYNSCFHVGRHRGEMIVDNTFVKSGPGQPGGSNPGMIMHVQNYGSGGVPDTQSPYDVIRGNDFSGTVYGSANAAIRWYSSLRGVIAHNDFHDGESNEMIAAKSDISRYTIRANTFRAITGTAIGGNNQQIEDQTYGEVYHNVVTGLVTAPSWDTEAYVVNQSDQAGPTYIYRNTFVGQVRVRNVHAGRGPFAFTRNVIVNPGGSGGSCPARITCSDSPTDYTIIQLSNNLQGAAADNIVDSNGNLQGSYIASDGTTSPIPKGYQIEATSARYRLRFVAEAVAGPSWLRPLALEVE